MSSLIVTGRARTTAHSHDAILAEVRAHAEIYDVTALAHQILVDDPTERYDLVDYPTLLPTGPSVWLEHEFPLYANLGGRFELATNDLTAAGVHMVTKDVQEDAAALDHLLDMLPRGYRRRVRRLTRYLVTGTFLVEMIHEGRRQLFPPVVVHVYALDKGGRLVVNQVFQDNLNAAGHLPPEIYELHLPLHFPMFEAFKRLRAGAPVSEQSVRGRCPETGEAFDVTIHTLGP